MKFVTKHFSATFAQTDILNSGFYLSEKMAVRSAFLFQKTWFHRSIGGRVFLFLEASLMAINKTAGLMDLSVWRLHAKGQG